MKPDEHKITDDEAAMAFDLVSERREVDVGYGIAIIKPFKKWDGSRGYLDVVFPGGSGHVEFRVEMSGWGRRVVGEGAVDEA